MGRFWLMVFGVVFVAVVVIGTAAQKNLRLTTAATPEACSLKGAYNCQMTEETVDKNVELKNKLTPLQYSVTQRKATEAPFTGKFYNFHGKGKYVCVVCGNELFSSDTKFDSGSGWPSFWKPISENDLRKETDKSFGMDRTEVVCSKCGAHLGHVFDDGPKPTGSRYCINSAALNFVGPDSNDADNPASGK